MKIDKKKPVLVTGATGYVAGWLVKKLLDEGITVHAAVRNPDNKQKHAHLDAIAAEAKGDIKYFKADLLDDGSFAEAMAGCELVFHTASPFFTDVKDPQKQLIEPALEGTKNVLEQVNKTDSVKRVVLTSSCAAIYTDASDTEKAPNGMLTEDIWNTTSTLDYQPYSLSKTLAEKEAWEMVKKQDRWDLVVMNPSFVMGPALNPKTATSESISILKQLANGDMKMGAPKMGVGVIDVRDLAEAHYRGGYTPEAHGRNIISAHNSDFLELGMILNKNFGKDYALPSKALPKWLLMLVGPFANKLFTRRYIRENVNHEWKADNSKAKRELGLEYRPLEETMVDGFQGLIDAGVFKK